MGGGVEQLLMIATVLFTTTSEHSLFLEEPESHLHAGAQRFLLEKLYGGERQTFITTHSPVFIDLSRPHSLYRVKQTVGRSQVAQVHDAAASNALLEDIGVRNSDVLLKAVRGRIEL
jgi:predicted ATP-dependent endonuclease of OLD family